MQLSVVLVDGNNGQVVARTSRGSLPAVGATVSIDRAGDWRVLARQRCYSYASTDAYAPGLIYDGTEVLRRVGSADLPAVGDLIKIVDRDGLWRAATARQFLGPPVGADLVCRPGSTVIHTVPVDPATKSVGVGRPGEILVQVQPITIPR